MKLTSPKNTAALLDEIGVRPSKSLGQNFMVDANILRIFLDAADLGQGDSVLEIGAGLGTLTGPALERAGKVTAVEIDRRLFAYLGKSLGADRKLELVCADALTLDFDRIFEGGVNKVIGNLPYSVGSRLLMSIVSARSLPERITVTVQSEVAGRLAAGPGSPEYGLLSVWVQLGYRVEVRKTVSKTCFWPVPRVESAVVNMLRRDAPAGGAGSETFRALTRHAFSGRRKQMASLLARWRPAAAGLAPGTAGSILEAAGIGRQARPGDLSPDDWMRLANAIENKRQDFDFNRGLAPTGQRCHSAQ